MPPGGRQVASTSTASEGTISGRRPIGFDLWIRSKLRASTARAPNSRTTFAAQSREDPIPYRLPAIITTDSLASEYRCAAVIRGISSQLGACTVCAMGGSGGKCVANEHSVINQFIKLVSRESHPRLDSEVTLTNWPLTPTW